MRYSGYEGEYGNYGRRGRYSEGRYNEGYGRRGGRGRYRGDDYIEDMRESYGEYNESRNYGAEQETMKSLDYMLKSVKQFMGMLSQEAGSQEEMEMIKRTAREIGQL